MRSRTFVAVVITTVLLTAWVSARVDWSDAALRDPARMLHLGPLTGFAAAHTAGPPVFDVVSLAVFLSAGIGLVVCGLVMWRSRPPDLTGRLVVLVGLTWIAGGLRRSSDPLEFTIGALLTDVPLVLIIHVLLGFPTGRLTRRIDRWFVTGCWLFGTVGVAAEWLFFDPRQAGASTSTNLVLIAHRPQLAETIQWFVGVTLIPGLAIMIFVVASRWMSGSPAFRAAFAPFVIAFVVVASTIAWAAVSATRFPSLYTQFVLDLSAVTMPILIVAERIQRDLRARR